MTGNCGGKRGFSFSRRAPGKVVIKIAREVDELERWLKRRKVYEDLSALAHQLGLKPDLNNLVEVAPQLLEEWNMDPKHIAEDIHIFITLLRRVRTKKALERQPVA